MKQEDYNKRLIKWVKNHYWDSLEKDKDLILQHLRTFVGSEVIYASQPVNAADEKKTFTGWIPKKFIDNLNQFYGFYVLDNIYPRKKGVRPVKVKVTIEVIESKHK